MGTISPRCPNPGDPLICPIFPPRPRGTAPIPSAVHPHVYVPTPREIEFLKKETAQRRVLEESELAHKEEMEKLQEKVGTGRRDAGCP